GHITDILDVIINRGQFAVGNGQQLGVLTGFVGHVQHAHGTAADNGARHNRIRSDHQHIQRVTVFRQGVGYKAVVGRIKHRGGHETVNHYRAHVLVDFVFDRRAVGRNFNDYVKVFGERSEEHTSELQSRENLV